MASGTRIGAVAIAAALALFSGSIAAVQPERTSPGLPDVDVREWRAPAQPTAGAAAEARGAAARGEARRTRIHPHTGAVRVIERPGIAAAPGRGGARAAIVALAPRLGLTSADLAALTDVREYASLSTGLRHLTFAQTADGIPVFDALVSVHIRRNGEVVRVTSGAAPLARRNRDVAIARELAATIAVEDVRPGVAFATVRTGDASLTWFPMDGALRLAWHVTVEPDSATESYDILVDAQTGERLLRRNRVRYADGTGRVLQSAAMQAIDPRRPDAAPRGASACPPPINYELRSLTSPFRDPSSVLFDTGELAGNNARIFRRTDGAPAAAGTWDGTAWTFDFPFNSAGSAETSLFFTLNYAHDFFYDLGFDEAAGNYQIDNFGRGGLGGDSVKGLARAGGRNNATFMPAPDGTSPTISMFLFDATGCWGADADGDGSLDLDGDYDGDIVLHEFAHGVSLRLNTAFEGAEADAMGEGISDFFAYSITGETTLAEYAFPGGIRGINAKTYADWTCFFGFFCEPHDNGEIWVNALWDVRERFRRDGVRGSAADGINESHQLVVDALKLSPPLPTMLDLRDAMLQADALRNPGSPQSANFCRIWEPFAARGMGLNATDTADNGFNEVGPEYSVPAPCDPPPPPPTVTIAAAVPNAAESGPTNGRFRISRGTARDVPLTVSFFIGGTATNGVDYTAIASSVTIPAGAADAPIEIVPVDDTLLEPNETVVVSLAAAGSYVVGTPSSGTVTIVSDDVAPDFVMTAFTAPSLGGAGSIIQVTDTVKNQGSGPSTGSVTSFYLSKDLFLDAADPLIGSRPVPELLVGGTHTATTPLTLPSPLAAGRYTLYVKADGPGAILETQEGNNLRYVSIQVGPDLTVTALTAPVSGGAGLTITVSDATANAGGGQADASTTTRFYLSTNFTFDAADIALEGRSVPPLTPGAVSSAPTVLTIPSATAAGIYYLIARADAGDTLPEGSETNNTRWTTIRIGPDLTVSALSAPSAAAPGAAIVVSDTTTNSGAGAAPASTTRFYLSTNYLLDATDTGLDARAVPPLAPGASSPSSTTVTMPPSLGPGLYYLIAKADAADGVPEVSDSNNTRYVLLNVGPDLVVSAVSAPLRAAPGGTVTVTETTRNIGAGDAPASATAWYLSANVSFDATDVRLAAPHDVPALAAGASASSFESITLPDIAPGVWYLLAVADDAKVVTETTEVNNARYTSIQIGPDLYVSALSVPSTFTAGTTVSLFEAVRNQGSPAAASRMRYYLSRNNTLDTTDIVLAQFRDVPPLAQNASSSATTALTIPPGLSGAWFLLIVADADDALAESSEANNVVPRAVSIMSN